MAGKHDVWLVDNHNVIHPAFLHLSRAEAIDLVDKRCTSDTFADFRSNVYWSKVRAYGPNGTMVYERSIEHVKPAY